MSILKKDQEQNENSSWEDHCKVALLSEWEGQNDTAHDLAHINRVMHNARTIQAKEGGDLDVIKAAVWLHDLINLPKSHPERHKASSFSAQKAKEILGSCIYYPMEKIEKVAHAIEAHSFSANIETQTLEAKIVQDADRLDAIGAIGIARCFAVSGALGRPLLNADDPLCENREPDDSKYAVDHFFVKLFKLPETMNTVTAKDIAKSRVDLMRNFLQELKNEQGF